MGPIRRRVYTLDMQQMCSLLLLSLSPQSPYPCGARLFLLSNVDKRVFIWSACSPSIMSQSASLATMWPPKKPKTWSVQNSLLVATVQLPFLSLSILPWPFLATHQHLQSCTVSLKESCRAQPMTARGTANSQHLVQAGAVRSYHHDRSIAAVDAAWQLVASDC